MKKVRKILIFCSAIAIELSACSVAGQLPSSQISQGGVVDNMEIENNDKKGDTSYSEWRITNSKEKLVAYLEKKYDDTFIVTEAGLKGVLEKNDYIVAHSKRLSDESFKAYILDDGTVEDEYYAVLKRQETGAYIKSVVEPYLGKCYVNVKIHHALGEDFTSALSLNDAFDKLRENGQGLKLVGSIYLENAEISETQFKKMVGQAKETLEEEKIDGVFGVYNLIVDIDEEMTNSSWSELKKHKENYNWKEVISIGVQ